MWNFLLSCSVTTSVSTELLYITTIKTLYYRTAGFIYEVLKLCMRDVTDSDVDVSSTDTFTHTQLSDCSTDVSQFRRRPWLSYVLFNLYKLDI